MIENGVWFCIATNVTEGTPPWGVWVMKHLFDTTDLLWILGCHLYYNVERWFEISQVEDKLLTNKPLGNHYHPCHSTRSIVPHTADRAHSWRSRPFATPAAQMQGFCHCLTGWRHLLSTTGDHADGLTSLVVMVGQWLVYGRFMVGLWCFANHSQLTSHFGVKPSHCAGCWAKIQDGFIPQWYSNERRNAPAIHSHYTDKFQRVWIVHHVSPRHIKNSQVNMQVPCTLRRCLDSLCLLHQRMYIVPNKSGSPLGLLLT